METVLSLLIKITFGYCYFIKQDIPEKTIIVLVQQMECVTAQAVTVVFQIMQNESLESNIFAVSGAKVK